MCPCSKTVKNHEDTKKSLAEFLWIQICCELRTSQGNLEGTSRSHLNLERKNVGGYDGGKERTQVSWTVSTMRMETREKCPPLGNSHSHCSDLCLFLFLNRAHADEGGSRVWGFDPPRGQKFFSDMQLFYLHKKRAVVPTNLMLDFPSPLVSCIASGMQQKAKTEIHNQ